jgi:hypothetical protein
VTMNTSREVIATFSLKPQLTVVVSGTGSGTVAGPGINCDTSNTPCQERYNPGDSVTLNASASSDSTFVGWVGCTPELLDPNQCTVVMDADRTATATFDALPSS